jgi:small subunit ribosomal protein S16
MSVKIRLSRLGKKNRPYWRIVAIDSREKRDGAYLENLGTYDPLKHQVVQLHTDRIQDWVAKGAICSPTVTKIMKMGKNTNRAIS